MVEVRKREKENISSLLRRFSERLKKSRVLVEAREAQFMKKQPNRRLRRRAAIVKEELKRQKTYLRKIGRKK